LLIRGEGAASSNLCPYTHLLTITLLHKTRIIVPEQIKACLSSRTLIAILTL
jgi:hypothetical protein